MPCPHCGCPKHHSLGPSASCIQWLKSQMTNVSAAALAPVESTGDDLAKRFDRMALKLGAVSKFVKARKGKSMLAVEVDALCRLLDADTIRASNDFRKLDVGTQLDVVA